MDKSYRKHILLVTIIVSLAIVFVPIYFFVLADAGDDNKFTVTSKKIVGIEDGAGAFDLNDDAGNDSSNSNKRVRTFDNIKYSVEYRLMEKDGQTTSHNIEGRKVLVEVLVPTSYEATLKYGENVTVRMDERMDAENVLTFDGNTYYYGSFEVQIQALNDPSTFDFYLESINTNDITTNNSIKPLIFIKETTDQDTPSIKTVSTLPGDISCELADSSACDVTITGREEYFVNMYSGTKKDRTVPVGLLMGLKTYGDKGIRGLIVPKSITMTITNSDDTKLTFNENSERVYRTYSSTDDYKINIDTNGREMPEINNGDITSSLNDGILTINVNNIKDYLVNAYTENSEVQFYYFSTNYFLSTLATRGDHDYADIVVTLTGNKNNSADTVTNVQILDSYDYILGNYSSNIDVYESSLTSETMGDALEYGKAVLNYGSDFILKTKFDYSSRSTSLGDGLTSLTNYVKIDNDVFKLINDKDSNKGYDFVAGEITSTPSIKIDNDGTAHPKVYFGFGEWNSNYFEIAANAPSNCPASVSSLTKEQLMNLYGGPCIVEKNTVKWAYSPVSENDIDGNPIESTKGPLVVKSTYISYNTEYIEPGASGTIELYGTVVDEYTLANNVYQITTSATAYGKNSNDYRYLGNEAYSGETLLTNSSNFVKSVYDFTNRYLVTRNNNACISDRCATSGASIIVSGIKATKPVISAHKSIDLTQPESQFYYYPIALKINANASRSDTDLRYDTIYVDIYMPEYMYIESNYGNQNEKPYTTDTILLSSIYGALGKGTPAVDANYVVYHYALSAETEGMTEDEISNLQKGILSNFVVYADIDLINTPNAVQPEIFTTVDFKAVKHMADDEGGVISTIFYPISSLVERSNELNTITLYNSSAVITKASSTPKNIEKNGSYTFNMLAYNHSETTVAGGYTYPNATLYYVLPYDGDLSVDMSSNIGITKYKVNFVGTVDTNTYKFYYATTGNPSNIIADEMRVDAEPSAIWKAWEDPNTPVSNVIAIKVVKDTPFTYGTYFGSNEGLTVNVETVGSSDGNVFYNKFHILAQKPDGYNADCQNPAENPDYCDESMNVKANYASSSSVTSIYARTISGFVFEDYDYNGIYTENESKLKDIPVSLYKIGDIPEGYDITDPTTFVNENDTLVGATVTGENGNYYFGGLASGNYYVSYTVDNTKYIVTGINKSSDSIPDSENNNSKASQLPNTNKAISKIISFESENPSGRSNEIGINLGLAIKKEMAISLNKYITEVQVAKNGKVDTYDYSDKNATQVSISVLNPKDTKVRVKYTFTVENTKYFPGYIGMIVDNPPAGMTFNPSLKENQYWAMYDNLLYYNGLSGKLLLPNEKQYFTLVLDLDLKEAGTYRNIVSARDITLMGEELPVYDFGALNTGTGNTEGGE